MASLIFVRTEVIDRKLALRVRSSNGQNIQCLLLLLLLSRLQSCPTLCDPIDGSPPGSPVPGILQARTLACVAISFSNAWKWKVKVKSLSRVRLFATPWTAAHQAPPPMGFSRQEYWSGVPLSSPVPILVYYNSEEKKYSKNQLAFFGWNCSKDMELHH